MAASFTPDFMQFLTELKADNRREWFEQHKRRYEASVKEPLQRFVADLSGPLATIAPRYVVDPRPVGGSILRIYRDVRFSKDKSPYKTAMAAHFSHEAGIEGQTPGFYLHLGPGQCGIGGGVWRPESQALDRIRRAIVDRPDAWQVALGDLGRNAACGMMGESLKRPPAVFDPSHPHIADIQRKDFAVSTQFPDADVAGPEFLHQAVELFRKTAPFLDFLAQPLGLR